MEATINYGDLKDGQDYEIIDEGRDYYAVRCQGKVLNAPMWVFEKRARRHREEEDDDDLDFI